MGKSKAPPPPDYAALAAQQGQESRETAQYDNAINRVDQFTPEGSITWTIRPGADPENPKPGDYIQTTQYSPEQQALYDQDNRISQSFMNTAQTGLDRVAGAIGSDFDTSGLGQLDTSLDTQNLPALTMGGEDARKRVSDAILSRINPELDRQENSLRSRLLNSGIEQGTDAWNTELERMDRSRTDAAVQADLAGGTEQSRMAQLEQQIRGQLFGEEAAASTFANQSRSQGLEEQAWLRQLPINEVNALRTGSQVQSPNFSGYYTGGGASPSNVYQAGSDAYGASVNATNAANANSASTWGTVGAIGGASLIAF